MVKPSVCIRTRGDGSAQIARRSFAVLFIVAFSLIFFSCATMRPGMPKVDSPIIRIGVIQNAEEITFQPKERMYISTKKAGERYKTEQTDLWKVRVDKNSLSPAKYLLQLGEFSSKSDAKKEGKKIADKGFATRIEQVGDELWYEGRRISGAATYFLVTRKEFDSKDEARAFRDSNPGLQNAEVVKSRKPLSGDIVLISPQGDKLAVKDAVRLSGPEFTIHNVQVGQGYHWSRKETRTYRGELEFRIDKNGKLTAINVLPLEDYIRGVLPGEMSAAFPAEALKAQAIAARTFFMYNFGRVHADDPFDACADVHCQVFVGTTQEHEKVAKAVRETRGVVLQYDGRLCTTPFSALCGGHTENSENVWQGDPQPHLRGVFDLEQAGQVAKKFDLSKEVNVRKWIESLPNVYCNVEKNGDLDFAAYAKKFFRWQVRFTRQELEQNIRKYTGKDFGALVDLEAASRGVSGRIIQLRVIGTKETFTVGKELRIRKALSPKTLYSACFVVDKNGGDDLADEFVIKGAGWGHGVGMCQIGAAIMAEKGTDAKTILGHYYMGTKIKRLY